MKPMESHSWYQEIANQFRKYVRDSKNILKKEYWTSYNSNNLDNRDTEWEKDVEKKVNAENSFF